jgi:hypothetical protein
LSAGRARNGLRRARKVTRERGYVDPRAEARRPHPTTPLPPLAGPAPVGRYARLAARTGVPAVVLERLDLDPSATAGSACAIVRGTVKGQAWREAGRAQREEERAQILLAAVAEQEAADAAEEERAA